MFAQTLITLVTALGDFFALALLLRFLLQCTRAPARNPLSSFVNALTNFAVLPLRRVVPGLWGLDLASLLLAWLMEAAKLWLVVALKGGAAPAAAPLALLAVAALQLATLAIYVVMGAIIVQALLSWVNPHSPVAPLLDSLTRPFLRPFQRAIPLVGGVDLSPLAALLVCQLVLGGPLAWLEANLGRLL